MRIWLKDSDRRPDPAPVKTDDRKAVLAGTGAWVVALAVLLAVIPTAPDDRWWLLTCAIGVGLGLLGLIYTQQRQR